MFLRAGKQVYETPLESNISLNFVYKHVASLRPLGTSAIFNILSSHQGLSQRTLMFASSRFAIQNILVDV